MPGIVMPQVLVYQQFEALPAELTQPLRAFLLGPEYLLHRYTTEAEKAKVGEYDYITGNTFSWLDDLERLAGSIVDQDYSKVYLEDALLRYWNNSAPAQESSESDTYSENLDNVLVSTPADIKHQVNFEGINLVDKEGYALNAAFYDRDVKVGDYLRVHAIIDGELIEGGGTITGFVADETEADVDTATSADANAATQIAVGPTIVSGADNVSDVIMYDDNTAYIGYPSGQLSEVYTVECIQGTTGANPSTGVFNITSASGTDDIPGFVPDVDAYSETFEVGTRGLMLQFKDGDADDIEVGDSWTITVAQAWTAPTATSAGEYTGDDDTTYIITVVRGGRSSASSADDRAQIKVTTSTGVDGSAPRVLDLNETTDIPVGNFGVEVDFSGIYLNKGDQYYIEVTAAGEGAIRTVILNRSLPDDLVSTDDTTVDLNAELCIKKHQELPATLFSAGVDNWEQDADDITVLDGAQDYDSTWRDGEVLLPIVAGDIYFHWRELIITHATQIYEIATLGELTEEFTTQLDPDNPLVYAASKALANSGTESSPSTGIRLMAVPTNDIAGYTKVLNLAEGRDDLYSIVPLTFDTAIQSLIATHVTNMSTPEVGQWRICFLSQEEVNPAPVVVLNGDDEVLLATTDSDRYLDAVESSFLEDEVAAGDIVRLNYTQDNYGTPVWDEFIVDQVLSETRLRLTEAPLPVLGTPSKIEIWRTLDEQGVVDSVGEAVTVFLSDGEFTSRRVYSVYPSTIMSGGVEVDGYHICAAIAGLVGASAPQQGLTNVELRGFDNVNGVVNRFSRSQLDTLANSGKWIITHDLQSGVIYTRHQLSTDTTDLNTRELSIVKNVDSISYVFLNRLKPYIGRSNVTPTSLEVIRTQIMGTIAFLQSSGFTALTGGQVLPGTEIRELRQHSLLKDRIVVNIKLVVPYPLNNAELTLVI